MKVLTVGLEIALEHLAGTPTSFLHGEFYASNVLVAEVPGGRRICPVDWEMAGTGPRLLDLAALCTGWDVDQLRAIADGYYRACDPRPTGHFDGKQFLLLRCAQLCLAVQWLGWARNWLAPPQHARDWLLEASKLAEEILG